MRFLTIVTMLFLIIGDTPLAAAESQLSLEIIDPYRNSNEAEHKQIVRLSLQRAGKKCKESEAADNCLSNEKWKELKNQRPEIEYLGSTTDFEKPTFSKFELETSEGDLLRWISELTITGITTADDIALDFSVRLNVELQADLKIKVESKPLKEPEWELLGKPRTVTIRNEKTINLVARTRSRPISNLKLIASSLTNDENHESITIQNMGLGTTDTSGNHLAVPAKIPANTVFPLTITFKSGIPHGSYKGAIELAPDLGDTKSLEFTLHASSVRIQIFGWVIIAAGLIIAFILKVLVRGRIARNTALLTLRTLNDDLESLKNTFSQISKSRELNAPNLSHRLQEISDLLRHDHEPMGSKLPSNFGLNMSPIEKLQSFQTYVQAINEEIVILSILINACLREIDREWDAYPKSSRDDAINQLNSFAEKTSSATRDASLTKIKEILNTLRLASRDLKFRNAKTDVVSSPTSQIQLRAEIEKLNILSWLILGLITTLVGAYTLIYQVPGFGSAKDLIQCFLWGIGLGVAGQKIGDLTPKSVLESFNVKLDSIKEPTR
jgi:hypothetical protein